MTEHVENAIIPIETETSMHPMLELIVPNDADITTTTGPVAEKLLDAMTPGYQAEFDPAEAEAAGAFHEDALSEADALASTHDVLHFPALSAPMKK